MVYINVTIKGKINSKELWEDIKRYNVNVTEVGEVTFVHGEASMYDSMFIIDICRKYGEITHELTSI